MIRLLTLWTLAWALLGSAATPALAHKPSDSYLKVSARDDALEGQWDIALRDLDHAIGLDGNDDGSITWGELKARQDAIASYAISRLRIERGDRPCSLVPAAHLIDQHSDGTYAVLRFVAHCAAAAEGPLAIGYSLFFDLDPQHRGLLRLDQQNGAFTAILSPSAPTVLFDAVGTSAWRQFLHFLEEGVWHIWIGFDHILFLLTLLLPSVLSRADGRWQPVSGMRQAFLQVLKVVTAFTVAHSITLSLAVLGVVAPPARLVESLIAFSVLIAAANNLVPMVTRRLWCVAFGFGLIHGFGFANVLIDLGLPKAALALALFGFNLGVELGQVAIVVAFLPLAFAIRGTWSYRGWVMPVASLTVAGIAALWLVERSLDLDVPWV
jgi:HupE / UreJ protein